MNQDNISADAVQITIRFTVGDREATAQVNRFPFLIGRDSSSVQLALPDATVSRVHAKLIYQDGVVLIENISTTNKTVVNDRIIGAPTVLSNGDRAVMGSSRLVFEVTKPAERMNTVSSESDAGSDHQYDGSNSTAKDTPQDSNQIPLPSDPPKSDGNGGNDQELIYCQRCGRKLPQWASFCDSCGYAISSEISGSYKFCGCCGAKISADARFCGHCGKPVNVAKQKGPSISHNLFQGQSGAHDPQKKTINMNLILVITGISVLLIAVIVIGVLLFGGRSYKAVVNQYIEATFKGDIAKMWDLLPKQVQEATLGELEDYIDTDTVKGVIEYYSDIMEVFMDELEDQYGKKWSYSYKITEELDYSKREIADLEEDLEDDGVRDMKVDAAKDIEAEITVKGDGRTRSYTITIVVIKVGRSWYLSAIDMF